MDFTSKRTTALEKIQTETCGLVLNERTKNRNFKSNTIGRISEQGGALALRTKLLGMKKKH